MDPDKLKYFSSRSSFFKKIPAQLKKDLFIVGGAISSYFYGLIPADIDLVCYDLEAFKTDLENILKKPLHIIVDRKGTKTIKFFYGKTHFDITQIDTDLEKDAQRRDFTINSIFWDCFNERIIDPLNGSVDLKKRILRRSSDQFLEIDPIRYLRYYRFLAQYPDLISDHTTKKYIDKFDISLILKNTANERIMLELKKLLNNPSFDHIKILSERGFLTGLFPFIEECVGEEQNEFHSFDVYSHSLLMFKWTEYYISDFSYKVEPYILKLAALFHDCGKPSCHSKKNGRTHFYDHENAGAKIVTRELKKLHFSKKEISTISFLVRNHMNLAFLRFSESITDKAIRKFIRTSGEHSYELFILFLADGAASHDKPDQDQASFLSQVLEKIEDFEKDDIVKNNLISGKDLLALGFKQSPFIGRIIKTVNELYIEGMISSKEEAFKFIKEHFLGDKENNDP